MRAERARITTYYVKEVLRELSERDFPSSLYDDDDDDDDDSDDDNDDGYLFGPDDDD